MSKGIFTPGPATPGHGILMAGSIIALLIGEMSTPKNMGLATIGLIGLILSIISDFKERL